jgi:hypothetical protein
MNFGNLPIRKNNFTFAHDVFQYSNNEYRVLLQTANVVAAVQIRLPQLRIRIGAMATLFHIAFLILPKMVLLF